jgi:hypothetical protein
MQSPENRPLSDKFLVILRVVSWIVFVFSPRQNSLFMKVKLGHYPAVEPEWFIEGQLR